MINAKRSYSCSLRHTPFVIISGVRFYCVLVGASACYVRSNVRVVYSVGIVIKSDLTELMMSLCMILSIN